MKKALFFDIDGTLVSFDTHKIPTSAIKALEAAKANGAGIFIATGRPRQLVNNLQEIEHLIDGYITTNGGYSFIGKKVVKCVPIPHEDALKLVQLSSELHFPAMIVGVNSLTVINPDEQVDVIFKQLLNVPTLGLENKIECVLQQDILQLTPIITQEQEDNIMSQLPGCISARWYPSFTDITARGADKGRALMSMVRYLQLDIEKDVIAFGDGGNDMPMLKTAGIGVAMGNAVEKVKDIANYVTTTVDNDGIYNALIHLNII